MLVSYIIIILYIYIYIYARMYGMYAIVYHFPKQYMEVPGFDVPVFQ